MSEFQEPLGGYGRIWESMYEGSLAGAGPEVFCLWPYVIAKMRMKDGRGMVMLNPKVLAPIFGVKDEEFVRVGIRKLCAPDPETKNGKEQEGRRLIPLGGHVYEVVNGAAYRKIRANEQHAEAQARYRQRQQAQVKQGKPLPGEGIYERTGQMPHEYEERLPEPPKVAPAAPGPAPGPAAGVPGVNGQQAMVNPKPATPTPGHRTYVLGKPGVVVPGI